MNYKSVNKYLSKSKSNSKGIKRLNRVLFLAVIIIGIMIVLKIDKNNDGVINKFLNQNNINFAVVGKWLKDKTGNIIPFENMVNDNTQLVFDEKIVYTKLKEYKEGVNLTVATNYLVPILESGIVVFSGEKEGLGNTVIIQQTDGNETWYANVTNLNVKIYDYVQKGEILGEVTGNTLYLSFFKNGDVVSYKEYFK